MRDKNTYLLNKENQALYAGLKGEYKIYAWQLLNALFVRCKPQSAINASLSDIFSMLSEAQAAGQSFSQIIPDPRTSIRETVLCFPQRKMRRRTVVALIATAALLLIAAVLAAALTPIRLAQPVVTFDAEHLQLSWQSVPHAQGYEVYADDELLGSTRKTQFPLPAEYAQRQTIYFSVTATGEGRWRDAAGTHFYKRELPDARLGADDLFAASSVAQITYPSGVYERIERTLYFSYNVCVRVEGDVLSLAEAGQSPMELDKICVLKADTPYTLSLMPQADRYEDVVTASIRLVDPLTFAASENPVLPAGNTLFCASARDDEGSAAWSIAQSAENFAFSYHTEFPHSQPEAQAPTFCMSITNPEQTPNAFWVAHNQSGANAPFVPQGQAIPLTPGEKGTATLPAGWTSFSVRVPEDADTCYDAFFAVTIPFDPSSPEPVFYMSTGNIENGNHFLPAHYWTSPFSRPTYTSRMCSYRLGGGEIYLFTLYLPAATEATYEIFYPQNIPALTEEDLQAGTITLSPGLNYIYWDISSPSGSLVIRMRDSITDQTIRSWYVFQNVQKFDFESALRTYDHTVPPYDGVYFYNPYDEPITLTLTAYYPQMN